MYLDIKLSDEAIQKITTIVNEEIEKRILEDEELIKSATKELIKGQVKTHINNLLFSEKYKNYLSNKIVEYLKNE